MHRRLAGSKLTPVGIAAVLHPLDLLFEEAALHDDAAVDFARDAPPNAC